jgi:molybdopterin synthase catalytic subunit
LLETKHAPISEEKKIELAVEAAAGGLTVYVGYALEKPEGRQTTLMEVENLRKITQICVLRGQRHL